MNHLLFQWNTIISLQIIPVKGDEKWILLSKIVDKLETKETKKVLARYKITPVKEQ